MANMIPVPTEDVEQEQLFIWARMQEGVYPELKWLFAIPNGGYRSKATAGLLRATGVKAGVPDLFLPVARGGYHGLWIEMKRKEGGKLSAFQRIWLDGMSAQGYRAVMCRGCEEAIHVIEEYLHTNRQGGESR